MSVELSGKELVQSRKATMAEMWKMMTTSPVRALVKYRRSVYQMKDIDVVGDMGLDKFRARVFREKIVDFGYEVDEYYIWIGLAPYRYVNMYMMLEDDETVEGFEFVNVMGRRDKRSKLRRARVPVPILYGPTEFTIEDPTKESLAKNSVWRPVIRDLEGKVINLVLFCNSCGGVVPGSNVFDTDCGSILNAWRNWNFALSSSFSVAKSNVSPELWLAYHHLTMPKQSAMMVAEYATQLSEELCGEDGSPMKSPMEYINQIQKEDGINKLPPQYEIPAHQPRLPIFTLNLTVEYNRFVSEACSGLRVPPAMVGLSAVGEHGSGGVRTQFIVQEERSRMLQDFAYSADEISYALRDVWLTLYGEMIPKPKIPLRCIASVEEMKTSFEVGAVKQREFVSQIRRLMGMSVTEKELDDTMEEFEKRKDQERAQAMESGGVKKKAKTFDSDSKPELKSSEKGKEAEKKKTKKKKKKNKKKTDSKKKEVDNKDESNDEKRASAEKDNEQKETSD